MMKILFAASASGGHILPALSVARSILKKRPQAQIVFLTERNKISEQIFKKNEFEVSFLDIRCQFVFSLQSGASIIKLLMTSFRSLRLLKDLGPDIVVGFGGYVSIVPILTAKLFRIRTIIHEQNVTFGRASRLLCHFADRIAVSFRETKQAFEKSRIAKKIIYTGLPLREGLKKYNRVEAARFFNFDPAGLTILVLGGSRGSSTLNEYFLQVLNSLSLERRLQVIHICGFKDELQVRSFYKKRQDSGVRIFPFLKEIDFAFSAADLCLCRSGASSIYELSLFRLPAIFIPYPYAREHQLANARILERSKAAVVLEEKNISLTLKHTLELILGNSRILDEMRRGFPSHLLFDGAQRLSDIIIG